MNRKQQELFGAAIGYVRATEGNPDRISEQGNVLVRKAAVLSMESVEEREADAVITQLREEKFTVVPDCRYCANPCGRTADFDLRMLEHDNSASAVLKQELIREVQRLAAEEHEGVLLPFYQGLFAIGDDSYDEEQLAVLLEELRMLSNRADNT